MLVLQKVRLRAVDAQLERNELVKLINKNGIEIHNSARHVLEEVMRGTGCVMGEKMSIFIENTGIAEKYIVVSRAPDSEDGGMIQKFPSSNFKDAWELFIK